MKRTLVIIPTFNELENLENIAARVLAHSHVELLVVDDNSPDGTGKLADTLAGAEPRLHVLHRAQKAGLGAAYCDGFAWALRFGFDTVVEMDGDGSHQPEELDRLLVAADTHDVVVGSRWVPGGVVTDWPWRRRLLSRAGSAYARVALGLRFRDITGGYRAYSAHALARMDLGTVASQGYCFQVDMLRRARDAGLDIAEVPITFVERRYGQSKMSREIVVEAIVNVTRWGLQRSAARVASERVRLFTRQVAMFLAVGGVGFLIDVGTFNILRIGVLSPAAVHGGPIIAKLISTSIAIAANWAGNRLWTFRSHRTADVIREGVEFAIASLAGLALSVVCLWISHYVLGYRSLLADNVSSNVIGLALGTGLRFVLYRWWVFGHTSRELRPSATLDSAEQL
jgi:dolichol-phosphate mannosyltransferase